MSRPTLCCAGWGLPPLPFLVKQTCDVASSPRQVMALWRVFGILAPRLTKHPAHALSRGVHRLAAHRLLFRQNPAVVTHHGHASWIHGHTLSSSGHTPHLGWSHRYTGLGPRRTGGTLGGTGVPPPSLSDASVRYVRLAGLLYDRINLEQVRMGCMIRVLGFTLTGGSFQQVLFCCMFLGNIRI